MLSLSSEIALPFPAIVTAFDFRAASGAQPASVMLSLFPTQHSEWLIQLRFTGVRDISIPKFPAEGIRCALFEVSEMDEASWRGSQWQDVKWMVGNFKMDTLTFYAKTAVVLSITRL